MLAPVQLPEHFAAWNRAQGSPAGYERRWRWLLRGFYSDVNWLRLSGPFGIQPGNNSTRRFEYPWAYYTANLAGPKTIIELGASLSGLQFVLSRERHRVLNLDPGLRAGERGWSVEPVTLARLNSWFRTDVRLLNPASDQAGLPDASVDIIFAISVLEHLTEEELTLALRNARRWLRPGGRFIITLDLFLNLAPFTARLQNEYGSNKDVSRIVRDSGLTLVHGDPTELNGFPAFDPQRILARLEHYLVGSYPVLTQCFVLQLPDAG